MSNNSSVGDDDESEKNLISNEEDEEDWSINYQEADKLIFKDYNQGLANQ